MHFQTSFCALIRHLVGGLNSHSRNQLFACKGDSFVITPRSVPGRPQARNPPGTRYYQVTAGQQGSFSHPSALGPFPPTKGFGPLTCTTRIPQGLGPEGSSPGYTTVPKVSNLSGSITQACSRRNYQAPCEILGSYKIAFLEVPSIINLGIHS